MNIWIVIWAFLATFVVGVTIWSIRILLRQKIAWSNYAKRHNLDCAQGHFMKSPVVTGIVQGYFVTILSIDQDDDDGRGSHFRTAIQFNLKNPMKVEGVIGSAWLQRFATVLNLPETSEDVMKQVGEKVVIFSRAKDLLAPYFAVPARIQTLSAVAGLRNAAFLLIFNEQESYLRFEIADPLDDVTRLEKLVNKIIDAAKILEA